MVGISRIRIKLFHNLWCIFQIFNHVVSTKFFKMRQCLRFMRERKNTIRTAAVAIADQYSQPTQGERLDALIIPNPVKTTSTAVTSRIVFHVAFLVIQPPLLIPCRGNACNLIVQGTADAYGNPQDQHGKRCHSQCQCYHKSDKFIYFVHSSCGRNRTALEPFRNSRTALLL